MLSKNQIKLIKCLYQKKYRQQHNLFVVEGVKTINELLTSKYSLHQLFTTTTFNIEPEMETIISVSELKKISFLKSPNTALAIFKIPPEVFLETNGLTVALDDVQDPGNLGTIIRLCDWFGVDNLVCSLNTVDCYNPKVVQATMGSIKRVNVVYKDLKQFLARTPITSFGAFMDGDNVYKQQLPKHGIIVMGNEGNGISNEIENCIDKKISIPQFGNQKETESLNVATATAILLSEFKRSTEM